MNSAPAADAVRYPSARKLGLLPLVCVMYLVVSGGAYGLEDAVHMAGPRLTLLLCLIVPITLSLPTALMAAELTALMPVEGGFYFWVRLPRHVSARALLDVALQEGVAFVPGDAFAIDADHRSALRFSISAPTPDRIDEGVRRLRRAFDRLA